MGHRFLELRLDLHHDTRTVIRLRLLPGERPCLAHQPLHKILRTDPFGTGFEIETIKQKAVSAQSLTKSLTTFGELYREALPEERRELIRLRVNQLVWKPDEIRLALLDSPEVYQRLGESQQLVARTGFEPVLPA